MTPFKEDYQDEATLESIKPSAMDILQPFIRPALYSLGTLFTAIALAWGTISLLQSWQRDNLDIARWGSVKDFAATIAEEKQTDQKNMALVERDELGHLSALKVILIRMKNGETALEIHKTKELESAQANSKEMLRLFQESFRQAGGKYQKQDLVDALTYSSDVKLVRDILNDKVSVNTLVGSSNSNPLILATKRGNPSLVKELLNHCADINAIDNYGRNSVSWALHQAKFYQKKAKRSPEWAKRSKASQEIVRLLKSTRKKQKRRPCLDQMAAGHMPSKKLKKATIRL